MQAELTESAADPGRLVDIFFRSLACWLPCRSIRSVRRGACLCSDRRLMCTTDTSYAPLSSFEWSVLGCINKHYFCIDHLCVASTNRQGLDHRLHSWYSWLRRTALVATRANSSMHFATSSSLPAFRFQLSEGVRRVICFWFVEFFDLNCSDLRSASTLFLPIDAGRGNEGRD